MRTRLFVVALLAAPLLARAQAVATLPLRAGEIAFRAPVSGGPDVSGGVVISRAEYRGADLAAVQGVAEAHVAEMRTGIGLRDRHLRGAMDADSFPLLRFDLDHVAPAATRGDTVEVVLHGRLTMHGVTRDVVAAGTATLAPHRVTVAAAFAVDLRDYGIAPPTRFLGTVRVQPGIAVSVHLTFSDEDGP